MKPIFFLFLLLAFPSAIYGQLSDDFQDGDFTNAPEWFGQTDRFVVTNGELQLMDEGATGSDNFSYLYLPALTSTDAATTWEFKVRLEFSPSTSNFAQVFLNSSSPDLMGGLTGYFVRIGGISGADDAVELFRQDGTSSTSLISGTPGGAGGDPVVVSVKVNRDTDGNWELLADYTGGTNYQLEGIAQDNTYSLGSFLGLYCRYTSTRNDAFFFDDILINPLYLDTAAPELIALDVVNEDSLILQFSENLNADQAIGPSHYSINNGIGNPQSVVLSQEIPSRVFLKLATPLSSFQTYTLTVNNIEDTFGNNLSTQSLDFTFVKEETPAFDDLIISEIMADPSEPVGLPNTEFVELHNRSEKALQLEGVVFTAGTTTKTLTAYLLLPGEYVVLCNDEFQADFAAYGNVLSLSSFPSLTNGGATLSLTNSEGIPVFAVTYADTWYQDEAKEDGGYTLELIDLDGPYDCAANWRASNNSLGGTPAQANSWLGETPDANGPNLIGVAVNNDQEVLLQFDETLDISSAEALDNYNFSPPLAIAAAFLQLPESNAVILVLEAPLASGTAYDLTIGAAITDCLGNERLADTSVLVGLPEPILAGDLVINEVLFNPEVGGEDFVELYNRSAKIFNLNTLVIANTQKETGDTIKQVKTDFLLFPGEYVVITDEPDDILQRYVVQNPSALLSNDLPTLEAESGNVTIRYQGTVIDAFDYDADFHYPLLSSERGVSLERISFDAATQGAGNWHSAASSVGYATPTYQNSQIREFSPLLDEMIDLPFMTFSPDNDGFDDVLFINYKTEEPGFSMNLAIYDAYGRLIRRLVNNETLGGEGVFKWDGIDEEGHRARIGIYVLWFELFSTQGQVESGKRTCVLAGRLSE
ncbi:MAG TPA: lamin tail domain-containing protein [Saprospiraceae bacterium]|nr:lamin tail domain-containing protein [Saprospiraceae bacterium]HMQ81318.1 lamin tail domain-containing protein [Saprospiraceae bacterium]